MGFNSGFKGLNNFILVIAEGYSSPNIVRVIKSRRMRWAGHVARIGDGRDVYMVLVGKPEGRRPLGRPRRDGRIILGWIFGKWDVGVWTGWS